MRAVRRALASRWFTYLVVFAAIGYTYWATQHEKGKREGAVRGLSVRIDGLPGARGGAGPTGNGTSSGPPTRVVVHREIITQRLAPVIERHIRVVVQRVSRRGPAGRNGNNGRRGPQGVPGITRIVVVTPQTPIPPAALPLLPAGLC